MEPHLQSFRAVANNQRQVTAVEMIRSGQRVSLYKAAFAGNKDYQSILFFRYDPEVPRLGPYDCEAVNLSLFVLA